MQIIDLHLYDEKSQNIILNYICNICMYNKIAKHIRFTWNVLKFMGSKQIREIFMIDDNTIVQYDPEEYYI